MITPRAKRETYWEGRLAVPEQLHVYAPDDLSAKVLVAFDHLITDSGLKVAKVECIEQAELAFIYQPDVSGHQEYYQIRIDMKQGQLVFGDFLGGRNAAATLAQLLIYQAGFFCFPATEIIDWPDCHLRGIMVDPSDRFMPVTELKDTMRRMALAKMNLIHLHLMDTESYAVRSEAVPELNDDAASAYSLDDLREIVRYGELIGIEALPEIELVVHGTYALGKLPALRCETETVQPSKWIMCVGKDVFFETAEKLIQEIAAVFPCNILHVGLDELVSYTKPERRAWPSWYDCKHCRALAEKLGVQLSSPAEVERRLADKSILDDGIDGLEDLLYHTIRRLHQIVTAAGKRMMMWNDSINIAKPVELPHDILVHFWRIAERGRGPYVDCSMARFLDEGFEIVNSHYPQTYLEADIYHPEVPLENWSPLNYPSSDPARARQILGGWACAWGNFEHFERTLPPEIAFYADRFWDRSPGDYLNGFGVSATRMLLGVRTPAQLNIFEALGGYFLPRQYALKRSEDYRYGCPEHVRLSSEQVNSVITALQQLSGTDTAESRLAGVYANCVTWVYQQLFPAVKQA